MLWNRLVFLSGMYVVYWWWCIYLFIKKGNTILDEFITYFLLFVPIPFITPFFSLSLLVVTRII